MKSSIKLVLVNVFILGLPLFVFYEFLAAKLNESTANTVEKEGADFVLKYPNNSVSIGTITTPNTNIFYQRKRFHFPKLTSWFVAKPS